MDLFASARGELAAHYAAVDWAATPLGPAESWSPALRAAVELTLDTRFAVTLLWGEQFVLIYNDAYAEIIADKHPAALGRPAQEIFPEAWGVIGPMLHEVFHGGESTWVEQLPLPLFRNGALREAFFTFSYSPVRDGAGVVEGVIDITAEDTRTVVTRRRMVRLALLEQLVADLTRLPDIESRALPLLREAVDDFEHVDFVVPSADDASTDDVGPDDPTTGSTDGVTVAETPNGVVVTVPVQVARSRRPPRLRIVLNPSVESVADAVEFVRLVAAALARAVDRARVHDAEAGVSEALQRSLLASPVRPPGLDIAVRYEPSGLHTFVGGDWFDFFPLADGSTALVVGDVMGHDRDAAAAMGQLRNLLRGIARTVLDGPAATLRTLDSVMAALDVGALATAVLCHIHPTEPGTDARRLVWSNAGHPPPLVRRADGRVERLAKRPNLLLGLDAAAPRLDGTDALAPGDTLLLFTDGLVERRDRSIDESIDELGPRLAGSAADDIETLCDRLLGARQQRSDDVALVACRLA